MKKPALFLALLGVFAIFATATAPTTASAKATTKVLSSKTMTKTAYRAVTGYMYTTAKLTKKAHNADNYPLTTFYTYKTATVRKANGNKAVYYYVKNGNGKVKGWIWRGHLVRYINGQKQLSQFNELVGATDKLSTQTHNNVMTILEKVTSATTMTNLTSQLTALASTVNNSNDLKQLNTIISSLKTNASALGTALNTTGSNLVTTLNNANQALTIANGLLSKLKTAA
ncbi:hypothetical protein [Secundilactobacillus similis]|uniref:D-alanyl-D-alanine carboxypeptidase n=1 Tax=Secundilactobacillus similis DSM 23365 = JCM 2765 TaxID=1423804 RepID=A0A0R2EYE9_9LACO|nr:hypothetical protein [Secundilactobacillus similis]KRN21182.1 hypothetical protein FD14_GL001306 [Secundilactobacillus similis DSM 23365 = JCM 2765]